MHPTSAPQPRWRWGEIGRRRFDVALASVLLLPVVFFPVLGLDATSVALGLGQLVPLYARRRHPVAVLSVVGLVCLVQVLTTDAPTYGVIAAPIAIYSVARFADARWGAAALGVGLLGAMTALGDWTSVELLSTDVLSAPLIALVTLVVAAWALGTAGRTRQDYIDALIARSEEIARRAEQEIALAAIEERGRIAREMHDVVAHGLSVIVVQADGARYAAARDPEVAAATLGTVAATARESLAEMRHLLGLLRADDTGAAPQPGLADLADLVAGAEEAGLDLVATLPAPDVAVPTGVALTAYRVAQEALTNARKHAGPARVELAVRLEEHCLEVRVEDDGRGAAAPDDGRGLGLLGMRERVEVHGGRLDAGPRPGGGFAVRARIPIDRPVGDAAAGL